jgi:hypothetical protein
MKVAKEKIGYNERWREIREEETVLRYLGPYFSRASMEGRVDQFFDQAFHVWLDRFPLTRAPDADADMVLWVHEVEKKVSRLVCRALHPVTHQIYPALL